MIQKQTGSRPAPTGKAGKKQDLLLIAVILGAACLIYLAYSFFFSAPAAYAEVSVDGQVKERLDLSRDTSFTITGKNGGTNRIEVKDGGISVTEASCPDKVCVHTGTIRRTGETIVCLPNRLIITIIQDGG